MWMESGGWWSRCPMGRTAIGALVMCRLVICWLMELVNRLFTWSTSFACLSCYCLRYWTNFFLFCASRFLFVSLSFFPFSSLFCFVPISFLFCSVCLLLFFCLFFISQKRKKEKEVRAHVLACPVFSSRYGFTVLFVRSQWDSINIRGHQWRTCFQMMPAGQAPRKAWA